MRLDKIKLSGFKSFVDPTTINFPSNLIGIVGPNGCGKSNVIDAVRWVMGESSAKQLRGESITDVIFNGSIERKPVGQASIELIFDNSKGLVGGEYAKYSEIAIRRVVGRDAQSAYFLNGTKCRRRDITDVFLGTGLGSRSYSIIEQGMVGKIVEAKPDELRAHFEEVAGISKYKERRRETENRIRHTRENLSRISDLREEIGKLLERLKRQSRAAARYKVLKEEERLLKSQHLALRWQGLDDEWNNFNLTINKEEVLLESHKAELQRIDTDVEKQLNDKNQYSDEFNEIQSRYYQVGSEIARIEQDIAHQKERLQQLTSDLEQTESTWRDAQHHLSLDQQRVSELTARIAELQPNVHRTQEAVEQSQSELLAAEEAMSEWQMRWETFNEESAAFTQKAQVEQTRIHHLEQQQTRAEERLNRIAAEGQQLNVDQLRIELEPLQTECVSVEQKLREQQSQYSNITTQITQRREENHSIDQRLQESKDEIQQLRDRYLTLEALQQAALGQTNESVVSWLSEQGLKKNARLVNKLKVDRGWECAVETVLGDSLQAVCVDGVDTVASVLNTLTQGSVTLLDTQRYVEPAQARHGAILLSEKLRSKWSLGALLDGVYAVDTLTAALTMRDSLSPHESVVTQDGIWIGRNWIRVVKESDAESGVIRREEELEQLQAKLEEKEGDVLAIEQRLTTGKEQLVSFEKQREALSLELANSNKQLAEVQANIQVKESQIQQIQERCDRLNREAQEHRQHIEQSQENLASSRETLASAQQAVTENAQKRESLLAERDQCRSQLEEAKQQAQKDKEEMHRLELDLQATQHQLSSSKEAIARAHKQIEILQNRRAQLSNSLSEGSSPIEKLESELEVELEKRLSIEKELTAAKQQVDNLTHKIQSLAQERHQAESNIQQVRNKLEQKRLHGQELKVRQATLQEQITETNFALDQLLEEMPSEATEESWAEAIEKMSTRISRLGPINLAAIEEYEQESERKAYLDKQFADLEEALTTLQNAIRKIDRETKMRFKETFDKVNENFQKLFPKVFGGGVAYLELTGEDLLETGISVMARPPGKRITSIHLLSGGEKALTATALIFSMFQLNPAPFCLLDEVDAPLDDSNVGRFCNLVKEMADKVQFIFISHNKLAIEMANHLMGITMNEPGVSRLVAVDVDEAVSMAEA